MRIRTGRTPGAVIAAHEAIKRMRVGLVFTTSPMHGTTYPSLEPSPTTKDPHQAIYPTRQHEHEDRVSLAELFVSSRQLRAEHFQLLLLERRSSGRSFTLAEEVGSRLLPRRRVSIHDGHSAHALNCRNESTDLPTR